jgi:DNA-nicking Smr family endonuclease
MTEHDKPRRPSHRRRLSEEEHALWRGVTRSIAPLKRRLHVLLADALETGAASRKAKPAVPKHAHPVPLRATPNRNAAAPFAGAVPTAGGPIQRVSQQHVQPVLVPLDRRLKRRLARGTEEIDARIDLHGHTQMEAHAALLRFLQRAQAQGAKHVLVITGKGVGGKDLTSERGVLKRQVPLWLTLPEFRACVVGVEEAHLGHGAGGALYVKVRQLRARAR